MRPDAATAFFRIFQEALTNVIRHAKATVVEVEFDSYGGDHRLEVRDNGVGITGVDLTHPTSLGMLGMRERAPCWAATSCSLPAPAAAPSSPSEFQAGQ